MRLKLSPAVYVSLFCCLAVLLVNLACQKKRESSSLNEETATSEVHPFFNKNVGGFIDSALANKWKRNLASHLSKSRPGTPVTTVYFLPGKNLGSLISSNKVAGICFYYGQDNLGKIHIVPVPVDVKGYIITVPMLATSNGVVSWEKATEWRTNFKDQHPNNVWGHFWGSVAVQRLLSTGTETARIELGLSDEGAQQIMLSDAAIDEPMEYGDRTRTCPPFCPKE